LYNSYALVDQNSVALLGDTNAGDLVQLILTGPGNVIHPPDQFGNPSGGDALLYTTYVGFGVPDNPNQGLLDVSPIPYDSSWGGQSNVYVRFWNSATAGSATYFGNSSIFTLPVGDAFNQASLDFVPLVSSPHQTDQPAPAPLSVTASSPILNYNGLVLPGSNPAATNSDCAYVPGCLVQILVASNGVAHLPNLDGTPGGGDSLWVALAIGEGMGPCVTVSGQLDVMLVTNPVNGVKIYARVFNAPAVSNATYWGQSATFTVGQSATMDLSGLGLQFTAIPEGVDLSTVDSKGQTYFYELAANTNPEDPDDVFESGGCSLPGTNGQPISVDALCRAGREYVLQRATALPGGWTNIASSATGLLSANANLTLTDPSPPISPQLFYRIQVTMP
jgi:hypothetical protein